MRREGWERGSFAGWGRCPLVPPGEGGRFDGGRSGEPISIIGTVGESADSCGVKSSQPPSGLVRRGSQDIHNLRHQSQRYEPSPRNYISSGAEIPSSRSDAARLVAAAATSRRRFAERVASLASTTFASR